MHNLYLIVGRTASGKDSLTRAVATKLNLSILSSYATRPRRPGETNEHIFITPEEVEQYKNDFVAYTKIGDYEYFSTKQQLLESDFYIIDPNGVAFLKEKIKNIPDIQLHIIYITASYEVRKQRALSKRLDNKMVFEKRCIAEEEQFINFECDRGWHKRIENNDFDTSLYQLEKYVRFNNNILEET